MNTKNPVFLPKKQEKRKSPRRLLLVFLALLLVVALTVGLVLLFVPRAPRVLSYRGVTVDKEMYAFWYATTKREVMFRHSLKSHADTAATWNAPCPEEGKEGMTWGEVLDAEIDAAIRLKLAAAMLYDELGLEMTEGQRNRVKTYVEELRMDLTLGDKKEMKELLAKYQTTEAALARCAVFDMKAELLCSHLALGGTSYLTAEEIASYYAANYRRVKLVYMNTKSNTYRDYENGEWVEKDLGFTGLGAQNDTDIEALDAYLLNGTCTEAIFDEYVARSDEALHVAGVYPSGIYASGKVDLTEDGLLEEKVADAAQGMEVGELRKVETENGVAYLFGCALDTGAWNRSESAVFFNGFFAGCAERAATKRASLLVPNIEYFAENREGISVKSIPYTVELSLCGMD